MDDTSKRYGQRTSSAGLRLFDLALRILMVVFAIGSVISLPLLAWGGTVGLDVRIDPPYTVGFDGGRSMKVDRSDLSYVGFPDSSHYMPGEPRLHAKVNVDRADTDTRVASALMIVASIGLAWLGLVNLRRIVRVARDGDPFNARNVIRLRYLAAVVVIFSVVSHVAAAVLDRTLDRTVADPPMHVAMPGIGWWLPLTIGLALFALAEVFRAGCELREFEQATI